MGVLGKLRRALSLDVFGAGNAARFKCIQCGEEFQVNHRTCPSCGAQYLADTQAEGNSGDGRT